MVDLESEYRDMARDEVREAEALEWAEGTIGDPTMYVVCIHVHVKPEHREEFIRASLENARSTIQEPGNLRFDVLEQADDPNRFLLYEVYRDAAGMEAHKATAALRRAGATPSAPGWPSPARA